MLSIIIPTLNESITLNALLEDLQPAREAGHQIVIADGGSVDNTVDLAGSHVDEIAMSPKGRGRQMNAGALQAQGDVLWFLHADTRVPYDAYNQVSKSITVDRCWGRFDIRLSGAHRLFRTIERLMNLRSCVTGIVTGDQGLFVTRDTFDAVGGFPDIPLMEDIALSSRLRRLARPVCLREPLVASSRRWEQKGIFRTILLMWRLRLAYALGVDPKRLAQVYDAA